MTVAVATAGEGRGTGPERAFAAELEGPEVILDPEESAHLVRSRRVRAGEEVVLFDGRGTTCLGRLVEADPHRARVAIRGPAAAREPTRRLVLAVSPPEAGRADRLVGALAELGVSRLVPLLCARTPAGRAVLVGRRRARWERLVRETLKWSGRSRFLAIDRATPFPDLLQVPGAGADRFLLDPDPEAAALSSLLGSGDRASWVLVGPEGGVSPAEVEAAEAAGWRRARLGVTALRVETAAMAAAAVVLAAPR